MDDLVALKNGKAYHVTSTHTASFDTTEARALRQEHFQQIRALVDQQNIPATEAVMMGGDFNVNKLLWPQDYAQMLVNLNGIPWCQDLECELIRNLQTDALQGKQPAFACGMLH